MPIYEYRCVSGHSFEVLQHDPSGAECPECGSDAQRTPARFAAPRQQGWGSDFEWSPSLRNIHDEAMGAQTELLAIKQEYESNGFTPGRNR